MAPVAENFEKFARLRGEMNKVIGIIGALAVVAGCGGRPRAADKPVEPPPLERAHPALAVVPAETSYLVVGRLRDVVRTIDEIRRPLALLPIPLYLDELPGASRRFLGVDVLSLDGLAQAGLDIDGSAAMFSTGLWPTFALPVRDIAEVNAWLERYRAIEGVTLRERDGVEVARWQPAETFAVTYAVVSGWLVVHLSDPSRESDPNAWLAATRAAMASHAAGAAADLVDAANAARASVGTDGPVAVLGLARMDRIAAAVTEAAGDVEYITACWAGIGRAVQRVGLGVRLDDGAAEGVLSFGLSPEAAAAVRANTSAGPPAGFRAYRARAGLYGDLAVDLRWLDDAVRGAGCPALGVGDATAMLGQYGGRGAHVAIEQFVPSSMRVRLAGYLAFGSRKAFTSNVLDAVPGRSLIESSVKIGGRKAKAIELGVVPRVVYAIDDAGVLGAVGSGVAEIALGASGPDARGTTLAAIGVRPERMPDLEESLVGLFELAGVYSARSASRAVVRVLSHYAEGELAVELVGGAVEVRGRMKLAR